MPQLEAWQKVLIGEQFLASAHAQLGCINCHGGSDEPQAFEEAHRDVVADPSLDAEANCDQCHATYSSTHDKSLHVSLAGYRESMRIRSGQAQLSPELEAMMEAQCSSCHTSCGQCHVSMPTSVGGGLVEGHMFRRQPSMVLNCTACHGSRVGEEFRGLHAGIAADVHYNRGFQCTDCHTADDVHRSDPGSMHRYDETSGKICEDCHQIGDENAYHSVHGDRLSCQVCHSQSYKNCYNCHVGLDSRGLRQPSEMDFKIGRNPIKSERRPYDYVVVRHAPIAPDTYDDWAPGQLTNFAALPTWRYATPHNIQRLTPQTENCTSSCHNNPAVFLTPDDLMRLPQVEQEANRNVVVEQVP